MWTMVYLDEARARRDVDGRRDYRLSQTPLYDVLWSRYPSSTEQYDDTTAVIKEVVSQLLVLE